MSLRPLPVPTLLAACTLLLACAEHGFAGVGGWVPQSLEQVDGAALAGLEQAECHIDSHEFSPDAGGTIKATSSSGAAVTVTYKPMQDGGTSLKVKVSGPAPEACEAEAGSLYASIRGALGGG